MKTLYLHIGFPRTGTTTLQLHLFPKHPQINYFGRTPRIKPYITLIDLACNLKNEDFDKSYNDLLKMTADFKFDDDKINILSSEFIVSFATHYNNLLDEENKICRTLKRIDRLFNDLNVKVNFFCSIRNQATIIPSFYSATSPELKRSMNYNAETIINYIKDKQEKNKKIQNFLDGYKYWEFYNDFKKTFNDDKKLKFFIYEEYKNEFPNNISNYLGIDEDITRKLINNKIENSSEGVLNEHPLINSKLSIIISKLKKNFFKPIKLLESLDKKIFNFYFLLKNLILDKKDEKKVRNFIKDKNDFSYQLNYLKNNSSLIKEFYKEDNLKFKRDLKIDLEKYSYFN